MWWVPGTTALIIFIALILLFTALYGTHELPLNQNPVFIELIRPDKSNLNQYSKAIQLYAVDWDDLLPLAGTTKDCAKVLDPYMKKGGAVLPNPNAGAHYQYNLECKAKNINKIAQPAIALCFTEDKPWPKYNVYGAAHLDGHVSFERAVDFAKWAVTWEKDGCRTKYGF